MVKDEVGYGLVGSGPSRVTGAPTYGRRQTRRENGSSSSVAHRTLVWSGYFLTFQNVPQRNTILHAPWFHGYCIAIQNIIVHEHNFEPADFVPGGLSCGLPVNV